MGGDLTVLKKLKADGATDDILPVCSHQPVKGRPKVVSSFDEKTWTFNDAPLPYFSEWEPWTTHSFVTQQWKFLGTAFPKYKYYKLIPNTPLPLLSIDSPDNEQPPSGALVQSTS
ncbi:hypothetical protein PG990_002517 [Apiospora arundinis]